MIIPVTLFPQNEIIAEAAASRIAAGVPGTDSSAVIYYETLHEALSAAQEDALKYRTSIDFPDEITLYGGIILDQPLIIEDNVHIRLIPGFSGSTIRRGPDQKEFPVIWVKGENASLSLGKPDMEHELIIDGGYIKNPPIKARAPLAAISGPGSKLVLYDGVTLQNNCNAGDVPTTSEYQNGAGVYIRTAGGNSDELHAAEFIMKGGTIRGNINDVLSPIACGGGVYISGFGIFTMEGGVIMDNTAHFNGGGFHTGSRGSFRKTGGIIYGSNAPLGFRNTALEGTVLPKTFPKTFGHAVSVAITDPAFWFRNDTVMESDQLSYRGAPRGNGIFGKGEKWDNSHRALWRVLSVIILAVLAVIIPVFFIILNRIIRKRIEKILKENPVSEINLELNLTPREKEICGLLLTELSLKQIAYSLKLSYSGVTFHTQNLYRKLGIQSRSELFVKLGRNSGNL